MCKEDKMNMTYLKVILITLTFIISTVSAENTILTASRAQGIIELDGHAIEDDWKDAKSLVIQVQDGGIGEVKISLKALYDSDYLYIYATWPDPTQSLGKGVWTFNGNNWSSSGDEDRLAFMWNVNNSIAGFNIAGCAMLCHGDRMHTNAPDERGDLWQWKSSRTNPLGYADDEWLHNIVVEGYSEEATEAAMLGDASHEQYHNGYLRNINPLGSGPRYYEPSPEDALDGKSLLWDEVIKDEAVEVTGKTQFNKGESVPGYVLKRPIEGRNDIDAKGLWLGGRWQVEFRRKLNTGHDADDVQFEIDKTYRFGIAVMDNTGGFEAYGKGHSFDLGAKTLEFGGLASEEVTKLSLIKDYLTVAQAYRLKGEREKAVSNIGDALIIYNEISPDIANVDPELYLSTKNQFFQVKRIPDLEAIDSLSEAIDQTILTFQGKRDPPEATLRLKLLVLWGRIQLFALVFLAFFSIVPILRAVKIGRKPTFRRLSIFILAIVVPLLFEGIGRIGILFKISLLQNFSFLTNELASLQWAILMFFGLLIAKSGFEEVDESIRSLEFYSAALEQDINKMKKLETELRSSEERYRGMFHASPIGLLEVKPSGAILTCNEAASKIIHCPLDGDESRSFLDFIKDPKEKKEIGTFLKEGESIKDWFVHLKGESGNELVASISIESIFDETGKPERSEIAIMDISERIKEEEERKILESRLAHSEKLASIGKLATGFAHEISNPLTNIQLATELIAKKIKSIDAQKRLEVITKNVDVASSVVRDLLDFSRQTQLNIVSIDLSSVLEDSLEMVSPRLKEIEIVKKIWEPIKVDGDYKQLQQVFANIIINSVQAMPTGGKLTIATSMSESFAHINFRDTGHGISEEQAKNIFDPFFTTKEVGKGTGLGLSLAYGTIKAHGGDIIVSSSVGKGTTITITLPLTGKMGKNKITMTQ